MEKSEKRKRQEHMLIHVCGMSQESLDQKSDKEVEATYKRHLSMM
jgi:hypothetical protein